MYYTNRSVDPLLVALHAMTWVDHYKLSGIVNAALVSSNFTVGTQHPELKHIHHNVMWFIHSKKWLGIPQLCTTTWCGFQVMVFVNLSSLLMKACLAANKPVKFRVQILYTLRHMFSEESCVKPASGRVKRWVFNNSLNCTRRLNTAV